MKPFLFLMFYMFTRSGDTMMCSPESMAPASDASEVVALAGETGRGEKDASEVVALAGEVGREEKESYFDNANSVFLPE
jgi:hypothetical protein